VGVHGIDQRRAHIRASGPEIQRGFFGIIPRGLGLATATTSATFLPQCEQRIRVASAAQRTIS
jgi:hypothetical protein